MYTDPVTESEDTEDKDDAPEGESMEVDAVQWIKTGEEEEEKENCR